jgi:xylose isomerase
MTHFPGIAPIKFEGPESTNPLAFKYYNADEVIMGKTMKEWLRFAVSWWHTFNGQMGTDPFSSMKTHLRPWDKDNSLETFKTRVDVAFEFFTKLGVEYYCFHDIDVAPEGNSLEEFEKNLDTITDLLLAKQKQTGVKCLWATQNLFSNPRYTNGAGPRLSLTRLPLVLGR